MTKIRNAEEVLDQALETFAASNRFGFLRMLQIGKLIGVERGTLGAVAEISCEKLIELRAQGIKQLHKLTARQMEDLAQLILALGNGGASEANGAVDTAQSNAESFDLGLEQSYSTVQLELDLKQKVKELQAHPKFQVIRTATVGQYWDPDWPSAPFEEALTIAQLVEMDVALLFKKRTTSGSRISYLTRAIERALKTKGASSIKVGTLRTPIVTPSLRAARSESAVGMGVGKQHPWLVESSEVWGIGRTPAALAMIESFIVATTQQEASGASLQELMSSLPQYITRSEFLRVVEDAPLTPRVLTQLGRWLRSNRTSPRIALIRDALQGPGCALASLARLVSDEGNYSAFSGLAAIVLARALKATQVCYGAQVCLGVWSLNTALIALVINEAKRHKSRNVARIVRDLCPAMDPFLHSWLCEVVRGRTPRKGRRKGK